MLILLIFGRTRLLTIGELAANIYLRAFFLTANTVFPIFPTAGLDMQSHIVSIMTYIGIVKTLT